MDPRGNKAGIDARFTPPLEQLAFTTEGRLEADFQGVWPAPLQVIVSTLKKYNTYMEVYHNLPGIEVYPQ